jgi:hypothetical protein
MVLAAGDDFFADALGLNYQQYIGALISLVAVLLIGSVIQWVR